MYRHFGFLTECLFYLSIPILSCPRFVRDLCPLCRRPKAKSLPPTSRFLQPDPFVIANRDLKQRKRKRKGKGRQKELRFPESE